MSRTRRLLVAAAVVAAAAVPALAAAPADAVCRDDPCPPQFCPIDVKKVVREGIEALVCNQPA